MSTDNKTIQQLSFGTWDGDKFVKDSIDYKAEIEKRKEEIRDLLYWILKDIPGYVFNDIINRIIEQEQEIIKQELIKFAKLCFDYLQGYEKNDYLKSVLNDLLKQYGIGGDA